MTISENLFERFCSENEIPCTPIPVAKTDSHKTPDYELICHSKIVIAEVKELGTSPDDLARIERLRARGRTEVFDPKLDVRVRKMIDDAMPQLRRLAKGKYPAIVVVYSGASLMPVNALEIRLAMYGQDVVEIGLVGNSADPTPVVRHRFGQGQKVGKQHNTTLSAVALLTTNSGKPDKLTFFHNKYAAMPFEPDWLRIPKVSHFQIGDRQQRGGLKSWEPV
jgi:hypothetical protein